MKEVKTCDLTGEIAAKLFVMLNVGRALIKWREADGKVVATKVPPEQLVYPEGWYYSKGCLRNKHNSTNGIYSEVPLVKMDGTRWAV